MAAEFTPRETVSELDRYIVGQQAAKRAVAVALRNRWRRRRVPEELRDEITPKNIILIGPTGVGKTEIARRLAKLADAPFVKVEASKFTEVGYVGRDVESMVRDLVEAAVGLVREEEVRQVRAAAEDRVEERLLEALTRPEEAPGAGGFGFDVRSTSTGAIPLGPIGHAQASPGADDRGALLKQLRAGELEEREISLELQGGPVLPNMQVFGANGMEDLTMNLQEMFQNMPGFGGGGAPKRRSLKVREARALLMDEELGRRVDMEKVKTLARERAESDGIVFLDEIDKIAGGGRGQGPDVSREGVQRDLLPVIEGSTVNTKYGPVKTDHVLFIAAGAFHVSEVSDLIPELQGRFPIRVELEALGEDDLFRVLTEPKSALTRQYAALMAAEGVQLRFTDEGVRAIAKVAQAANAQHENIGARRLHTVMERLLEDLSFRASERGGEEIAVDAAFVNEALSGLLEREDLSRYIL